MPRRHPWLAPLVLLLGAALSGCADRTSAPRQDPDASPLSISWIAPRDGESLADTVRCILRVEGATPIRLDILSAGRVVCERDVGPWTLKWLPADTVTTSYRMKALAWAQDSTLSTAPEIGITWSPNLAPSVRLKDAPGPVWLERAEDEALEAIVDDPEDGPLAGDAIAWHSDRQGLLGTGLALPASSLIPGTHMIRVRATDHWLRSGWAEIEAEAYRITGGATPEGAVEDLRFSLLDRRPDRYGSLLAPGFLFIFCPSERESDPSVPPFWQREEEERFANEISASLRPLRARWKVGATERFNANGRDRAKLEIEEIDILFMDAGGESLAVTGGRGRVYFERDEGSSSWRIAQWQDLGSDGPLSQGRLRLRAMGRVLPPIGLASRSLSSPEQAPTPAFGSPPERRPRTTPGGCGAWRSPAPARPSRRASSPDPAARIGPRDRRTPARAASAQAGRSSRAAAGGFP